MIAKDYEPARYWFESEFKTNCLEPRMAPVKGEEKPPMYKECGKSADCKHPMFKGGCCMTNEIVEGHDLLKNQPKEMRGVFEKMEGGRGVCAPAWIMEYMHKNDGKYNLYEYEREIYNNAPKEMKEMFF